MQVKCPHCLTIKTIDKTDENKQIRCSKREGGCGERFYTKENVYIEPKKKTIETKPKTNKTVLNDPTIREDLCLGADFNKTVLIAGLMDTIKIYKNKVLSRNGRILKQNSIEGKKVLEWVEIYDDQKPVPMLVVHQAYFQKVDLAYKELKKLRE